MSAERRWTLTPDEFAWSWRAETDLDEYPDPISIIESATTKDEHARLVGEISGRYPRKWDTTFSVAMRVLANPDVRIVCTGRSLTNSSGKIRIVGAAIAETGALLRQVSGSTGDFGSDIDVAVTRRGSLGKHIAAMMPTCPVGTVGPLNGYTRRVRGEGPPAFWGLDRDGNPPVDERIRSLLMTARTIEGNFRIERYRHDRRPPPATYLNWIDISDRYRTTGRYLIDVVNDATTVTPASAETIAKELHRRAELDNY